MAPTALIMIERQCALGEAEGKSSSGEFKPNKDKTATVSPEGLSNWGVGKGGEQAWWVGGSSLCQSLNCDR